MTPNVIGAASDQKLLATRSLGIFAARVVGTGLMLVATLLMARMLGPEDFGLVFAIWSPVVLLSQMSTLNLTALATVEIAGALARGEPGVAAGFVRFGRSAVAVAAPVAALGACIFLSLRFPEAVAEAPLVLALVSVVVAVLGMQQLHAAQAVALGQASDVQVPNDLLRPLVIVGALGLVWAMGGDVGPVFALAVFSTGASVALVMQLALTRGDFAALGEWGGITPVYWLKSALALAPSRMLMQQFRALAVMSASLSLGLADTGVIALALSLVGLLTFGILAVDMTFGPDLAQARVRRDNAALGRILATSGLVRLVPVVAGCLVIGLAADPIVALFGMGFDGAGDVARVLLIVPLVRAALGNGRLLLQVDGHRGLLFCTSGIAILALLLLPQAPFVPREPLYVAICVAGVMVANSIAEWLLAWRIAGVDASASGAVRLLVRGATG